MTTEIRTGDRVKILLMENMTAKVERIGHDINGKFAEVKASDGGYYRVRYEELVPLECDAPEPISFAENASRPDKVKGILEEMFGIYERKNADYGDSYHELYKDMGRTAGYVPIANKVERVRSIVKGHNANYEGLRDSLLDLANYAVMFVAELDAAEKTEPTIS